MCRMTERSVACDNSDSDGNTVLVGSDDNKNIFIPWFEFIKFSTENKNLEFIPLVSCNMISTAIALGGKYEKTQIS